MSFVLMPYPEPQACINAFREEDLAENLRAALDTLELFFSEHACTDPMLGANALAWQTSIMRLAEYAELMSQAVCDRTGSPMLPIDLTGYVSLSADDKAQSMNWPDWVGDPAVHEAHQGYLIGDPRFWHRGFDGHYRDQWPSVPAYLMPFPGMEVHRVFH